MTTPATMAAVMLLTCLALNHVYRSGAAGGADGPPTVYGWPGRNIHWLRSDGGRPPVGADEDGEDEYADGDPEESEDQLDQDDPVSTVTVNAVRGSVAWLPCDIGGGNNDGLPAQTQKVVSFAGGKPKDSTNTMEDRAYMVLWFKHQQHPTAIRHQNGKSKNRKISSGGKPLYSFDVRGRPLAHALKWSSDESSGGFGTRATFVVFGGSGGSGGGWGRWSKQRLLLEDYVDWNGGVGLYDNSSKAALRVTNVTELDAGAYRCRVDFRDSPTRNYRIILHVIVPPHKITISYNGGTEIEGETHQVIGPVPEGGQLVLLCRVHGGKPKPRVQWYSADGKVTTSPSAGRVDLMEEISLSFDTDDEETTTKKLVINQLNRSHANSTYTCLAGNDDTSAETNLRMTVMINMYLNVKSVRIVDVYPIDDESENIVNFNEDVNYNGVSQGKYLVSGKWYTGECRAEGASPRATIEWSIEGNGTLADEIPSPPLPTHITVVEQTERSSKIRFRPTPSDDGRYLRCRAWNSDINTTKDNVKNKALLLNIQYPPIVKLSLGQAFDPGRIKTGDDVYFECKVLDGAGGGRKQRNRIEWYHNGHPILQNRSSNSSIIDSDIKVVLLSAGTLVMRNVGRRHSGRYTCQCSNDLGTGRSRPVALRVQYAPVCADDGSRLQMVGVVKNENSVRVTCRVRCDPADERVQFEWIVWPAAVSELHQQRSPSVVSSGNYVTSALAEPRNDTAAAGLVAGELVLAVTAVPDVSRYADRPSPDAKKPIVLDTVSCRATNAVGRQQHPCMYHLIPAATPGPLTDCSIRLPKDQDRHLGNRHQRRRTSRLIDDGDEDKDVAIISCGLETDGGVRPVTYSLEIYESNVLAATIFGSTDGVADFHRSKYRGEWLVDNVTGTDAGDAIEYRVNRNNLRLRIDANENQKYLSFLVYAGNRIGRGPQTYFDSENVMLLKHSWWWHGKSTREGGITKTAGPAATLSTEWWVILSGGDGDDDRLRKTAHGGADGGRGTATGVVVVTIAVAMAAIVVALVLLWWRRGEGPSAIAETTIATNLIETNDRADGGEKNDKKYSLLSEQQQQLQRRNVYPTLNESDDNDNGRTTITDAAPDIMIQQNYGKRCLVSIANHGIPGPESCV